MQGGEYGIDIVVQGFPGKSVCHGGLGWSTIALLRGAGRVALVDVGAFNYRKLISREADMSYDMAVTRRTIADRVRHGSAERGLSKIN